MQLVVSLLAYATLAERGANRVAAWKILYARWSEERRLQRELRHLHLLSPRLLDDMGLAHLAPPPTLSPEQLPGALLPLGRSVLPWLPRA